VRALRTVACVLLVATADGHAADVFRDTAFYAREDGKMVPVDRIPADVEIVPLKATPDGQWLRVWWKEREGWIRARDVRGADVKNLRAPAAFADATEQLSSERNAVRLELGLQAQRVGSGFGAGYFRRVPALELVDELRVDVGALGLFFPTPLNGVTFHGQFLVRALRPVLEGKSEVGGELGAFYNRFVRDDPFAFGDNVFNTFGAVFGPTGTYAFRPDWKLGVHIRVLLGASVNTHIALGLEHRF
jgi:hypothetical protein